MIDIERTEVIDILDKMQFFQGQRAGRELWNDKPVEVQEMDLESFNRDIRTIRDYILQLEEKATQPKVGEWIPCSERLPEDEKTKLVTLSDGKVEGAFWNERNWWCMGDSINLETRTEDVIAWMELPATYNAERGGKNE